VGLSVADTTGAVVGVGAGGVEPGGGMVGMFIVCRGVLGNASMTDPLLSS